MTKESPYILVLTHDVDLLSVRELPWHSRTLWGFIFRCLVENFPRVVRGRISFRQYIHGLISAALIPFVKSGLLLDPIEESFDIMLDIERRHNVRSTLYFIPEARNPGTTPLGHDAPKHRAAHYRIEDLGRRLRRLEKEGWEIGVHGIDAHRDVVDAHREFQTVSEILGRKQLGHRSHWLYGKGRRSWNVLRDAGFIYDATYGSNFEVGWPQARKSPFRPFASSVFTVLPLNIQDGTLLDRARMGLEAGEAWKRVSILIGEAKQRAGVITVLWHTHSFSAPRYWGGLYEKIIVRAKNDGALIVPARQALALWRDREEPRE